MQDKILLGFLMKKKLTGYEVKKIMEHSTEFFFNTSLGSIYPAFQKLVKEGLAEMEQSIEDGRVKKSYSITQKGKEAFQKWLSLPPSLEKYRDEALLKIFFFSDITEEERIAEIESYIRELDTQLEELMAVEDHVRSETDRFQVQTLQYGLDYYTFKKQWYEKFLKNLKTEGEPS